ncbi:MAG: WG repeat-containing protein, partial [Oscillospiraceae bacterium]
EVADYYKMQNDEDMYLTWCEEVIEKHPKEPKAYDALIEAYYSVKDYTSCFDIIERAKKRKVKSDYIDEIKNKLWYEYQIEYSTYTDVKTFSNNFCAVKGDKNWGFVDRFGNDRIGNKYQTVGSFTASGFAPVVSKEKGTYFIDKDGDKVIASKEAYLEFGLLNEDMFTAKTTDNKYTYLNKSAKKLFGDYDYASTMNQQIAVVKNGGEWSIINQKGETQSNETFDGFVLDEKDIAFRNDRLFAKKSSLYYLVDKSGKKIINDGFTDAKMFLSDKYAAVKKDNKWGFIDNKGKMIIEPKYDDARSFSNGLAAVKIADKWGFINEKCEMVIEPNFDDAKDFNEKGSCFVKNEESWQLLKLYSLNRED